MRFTISLQDDLYRVAKSIAKAEDTSMSQAINQLIRRGLETAQHPNTPVQPDARQGTFPISRNCRPLSEKDVYDLEEAEDIAKWNGS